MQRTANLRSWHGSGWQLGPAISAASLLAAIASSATALVAVDPPNADMYAHANHLVDIGNGRRLNLVCAGQGAPTVIFEAGLSGWSRSWVLVQPQVAALTRACSYDRAGMGFSSAAPAGPRTSSEAVDDLHALLRAAHIAPPLVLVGHSMGAMHVRLYADRYPADVAGMVLVDPAVEAFYTAMNDLTNGQFKAVRLAGLEDYRACVGAATVNALSPANPLFGECTSPESSQMGPTLIASQRAIESTASYQRAQLAELEAFFTSDLIELRAIRHRLGSLPLIVLTAGNNRFEDEHGIGRDYAYSIWLKSNRDIAGRSTAGIHRVIERAGHMIQLERPDAVLEAIVDVLRTVRRAAPPWP
jgi:pimeloyl-ACP methyl ester carboxylesterase